MKLKSNWCETCKMVTDTDNYTCLRCVRETRARVVLEYDLDSLKEYLTEIKNKQHFTTRISDQHVAYKLLTKINFYKRSTAIVIFKAIHSELCNDATKTSNNNILDFILEVNEHCTESIKRYKTNCV